MNVPKGVDPMQLRDDPRLAKERPVFPSMDYDRQPFILAWELTRACNLACIHCRAAAQIRRHPLELSTDEALGVIDAVAC
ncbi:MAG: hypothetical protein R2849_00175 [Thermomicrobiales bacterium]